MKFYSEDEGYLEEHDFMLRICKYAIYQLLL